MLFYPVIETAVGAVRSHTVGWHSGRGSHHIASHTYTCTQSHIQKHTHSLFYCGPLLMARHDFFPFVWCCQRQSYLEYPKLIHSEHQLQCLAIFFLFINLPAEWLQKHCKSNILPAIKHLYECFHGLQSIPSLLFTRVDLVTGFCSSTKCFA